MTRVLMKSCFSCGDDPSQIPEGRPLYIEISMVKFSDSTCLIVGSASECCVVQCRYFVRHS